MKHEEFTTLVNNIQATEIKILNKKGGDYDKDTDRLSSFKAVAEILNSLEVDKYKGHTSSGIALTLLILKLVRDGQLRNSGLSPNNETRIDTLIDARNYILLYLGNEIEAENHHSWDTELGSLK